MMSLPYLNANLLHYFKYTKTNLLEFSLVRVAVSHQAHIQGIVGLPESRNTCG